MTESFLKIDNRDNSILLTILTFLECVERDIFKNLNRLKKESFLELLLFDRNKNNLNLSV